MNNNITNRIISATAFLYNADDHSTAICIDTNLLISDNPEKQFYEMKTVAERRKNPRIKKWALTGYVSPARFIADKISNEELKEITLEALREIGLTDKNQYRFDVHNSTNIKHLHFILNRISVSGECTIQTKNTGIRFGNALREACRRRNIKTDIEIGKEKRAEMLKALEIAIKQSSNFEELSSNMSKQKYLLKISSNSALGVSGLRIVKEEDINNDTKRIYKPGYTLSQITNKLKVNEIKEIFTLKQAIWKELNEARDFQDFRDKLFNEGIQLWVDYKKDQHGKPTKVIEDIFIKSINSEFSRKDKNGFFYNKYKGFSINEVFPGFQKPSTKLNQTESNKSQTIFTVNSQIQSIVDTLLEPSYTPHLKSDFDDLWKRKKSKKNKNKRR